VSMATDDLFPARLDSMIDMRHPLAVLATRMPCVATETALAPASAHKSRVGKVIADQALFGTSAQLVGARIRLRGRRQRLPIRLMVPLLYLVCIAKFIATGSRRSVRSSTSGSSAGKPLS
jgi:transposase, IS5 family